MEYGSWNLKDLKAELKSRGARVSGRKADLVERLESYDRNSNFGGDIILEPEFEMELPSPDAYKDVNSDSKLPFFTHDAITCYLQTFNKKLGSSAKNLYTSKFLKYVRFCQSDSVIFLRSECRAEMKKHVSYKVDISIDEEGCVFQGQCECAVGQGPSAHCKHVCALLYGYHNFATTGKILTEMTCTQQLQTFHQSKPYTGSPIKAAELDLSSGELPVKFDPRAAKNRHLVSYRDHFRNVWLNTPGVNTLPVSQMYAPANPYALNHDHDYLKLTPADTFLQTLNVSEISDIKRCNIEVLTRGQAQSEDWRMEHSKRITSSVFGKICLSTDRTNFSKLAKSLIKPFQDVQTAPLQHGRKHEKVALQAFEVISGLKTLQCGMCISSSHPYLAASPDALVGEDTTVEVKCPFTAKDIAISEHAIPYLKVSEGKLCLDQDHPYYFQVQGQLYCTNRQKCIFIVYTFKDIKYFEIARDDMFIEYMVAKLVTFYETFFKQALLDKLYFRNYDAYSF